MTDCGAVHDWIGDKGFQTKGHVLQYVSGSRHDPKSGAMVPNDERWKNTGGNINAAEWGAFWNCVDDYDFQSELLLVNVTIHSRTKGTYKQLQLRRRDRLRKVFIALDLDPATRSRVRELIGAGF